MEYTGDPREVQFAIWRRMTPAKRLSLMGRITATALVLRDRRLRQLHPEADEIKMRQLRVTATLASSPTLRLP